MNLVSGDLKARQIYISNSPSEMLSDGNQMIQLASVFVLRFCN